MASQRNHDDLGESVSLEAMSLSSERGSPTPSEEREVPIRGRGRPPGRSGDPPLMQRRLSCTLAVDDPTLLPRRSRTRSSKLF